MACTLVWFRRDLRLEDNHALSAAVRTSEHVVPVFIWAPEEEGQFLPGRVSRWWLKQSLTQLSHSLKCLGSPLVMRRSPDVLTVLLDIAKSTGATNVFYNHLYDPISLVRDHKVKQGLLQAGISVATFNSDLLFEPWEINDPHGQPFTTFTGFWKQCLDMPVDPEAPILPPKQIPRFPGPIFSLRVDDLDLEDESEKGSNDLLARAWVPGWPNADKVFESFLNGPLVEYGDHRQQVDSSTTSLLSPHLHFGEVSVRKIFHCVRMKQILWVKEGNTKGVNSINAYLRSIGLREYSRYISFNFPFTRDRSLLSNLRYFPWRIDEGYFKVWRQGRTGYPLVDASMRELWATGWLHNRLRVVVACFFVKFLLLPWHWGLKYFWDTLLDADLESDILGWQYISGGLPDGHDINRIDNPENDGCRYDPDGEYVRRWLPELSRLPSEWIHHPWDAPSYVLCAAGVELGSNYPRPIVEIATARERLRQSLKYMLDKEAAERCAEEGLGDTNGLEAILEQKMDIDRDKDYVAQNDQMVPSMGLGVLPSHRSSQVPYKPSPMHSQGPNDDTESTAEFSSNQKRLRGAEVSAWPQYISSQLHQEDPQRHRVLST